MQILEVNNLTLNPDKLDDYLVVPDESTLSPIDYPAFMGRIDLVWITKDVEMYEPNILKFLDMTEDEYLLLDEIEQDVIYRIFDEEKLVKLYFNGVEYTTEKGVQLVGDSTLFVSNDGILYTDILSNNVKAVVKPINSDYGTEPNSGNIITNDIKSLVDVIDHDEPSSSELIV